MAKMNKAEKQELVASLRKSLMAKEFVAVMKNHGLTVADVTSLRKKIHELGETEYKVAKNTLMSLAVKETEMEQLVGSFVGPTSIAYSNDFVGLSKILVDFSKTNEKLTVLSGFLHGKLLSDKEIVALSKLPSLVELMSQIVSFLQAPAVELHRVIEQISKQGSEEEQLQEQL